MVEPPVAFKTRSLLNPLLKFELDLLVSCLHDLCSHFFSVLVKPLARIPLIRIIFL